ncbi:MAG: DUF4440 domain-containing protein [Chlamydiota bacterium]
MKKIVFLAFMTFSGLIGPLQGQNPLRFNDELLGEMLVNQIWEYVKAGDRDEIEAFTSSAHQMALSDGVRSREGAVEIMLNLNLSDYILWDFNVTRSGPTLIVTYYVIVEETLGGHRLPRAPAPRMSLFQETEQGWKFVAHAILRDIPE